MSENKNKNKVNQDYVDHLKNKIEIKDKFLLDLEIVLGIVTLVNFLIIMFIASSFQMQETTRIILILIGFVPFIIAMLFALRIEQKAGYYCCEKCKEKYIPTYMSVFLAPHIGRTRYMKCPKCGEKTWHKKMFKK